MKEEMTGIKYVYYEEQKGCSCHHHTHETEKHVCGCGHHEHGKEEICEPMERIGKWKIRFEKHEGAVVASMSCEMEGEYEKLVKECEKEILYLAHKIEENGGLIGHIKMYVKEEGRSCMLSLTDSSALHRKEETEKRSMAEGVCIVIGMDTEGVRDLMHEYMEKRMN